jgi:hypothetical protein
MCMLLLHLLACVDSPTEPVDTDVAELHTDTDQDTDSPPSTPPPPMVIDDFGGIDFGGWQWEGSSVSWAVDTSHGYALVTAARLDVAQDMTVVDQTDTPAEDWLDTFRSNPAHSLNVTDVLSWPVLTSLLSDPKAIDKLASEGVVFLALGDVKTEEPWRVFVATEGTVTFDHSISSTYYSTVNATFTELDGWPDDPRLSAAGQTVELPEIQWWWDPN